MSKFWRLRNALNLAPAYIYRARWRTEQDRSAAAITELRALEAWVGPEGMGGFRVYSVLNGQKRD